MGVGVVRVDDGRLVELHGVRWAGWCGDRLVLFCFTAGSIRFLVLFSVVRAAVGFFDILRDDSVNGALGNPLV